jgi:hypothetical protein
MTEESEARRKDEERRWERAREKRRQDRLEFAAAIERINRDLRETTRWANAELKRILAELRPAGR